MSNIANNQVSISFMGDSLPPKGKFKCGEFLAGGGGVTRALCSIPDVDVRWVLNHDKTALRTNMFHHKNIRHYWADIYVQDEHELEPVDFVWASIECDQHSRANGGRDKKLGSYMMGWELYRYVKFLAPLIVGIENVPEFKKWSPVDEDGRPIKKQQGEEFERWKNAMISLGYEYIESIRIAADDGIPTRRERYFSYFFKPGIDIEFPKSTHSKHGDDGKEKWLPCRPYIDTENTGHSIFGREFNQALPKHLRKPYCKNTLKRIAGGVKRFAPEVWQFLSIYNGNGGSSCIDDPIHTITTRDRHQLITIEKIQFIQDHCHTDNYNSLEDPMNPVLTRQTKQIVTMVNRWVSHQNNSNGNPGSNNQSIDEPVWAITTEQKVQFITSYFNSGGNPGSQVQSLDSPINTILTAQNKKQLVTLLDGFDIKARFLTAQELGLCSTFPADYFTNPGLKLSQKKAVELIGNAVPPDWARMLIEPAIKAMASYIELFKEENLITKEK